MENGPSPEVIRQFNRIALLPDRWDHNRQYHRFLLDHIVENRDSALDVGCGTGEFTRELAARRALSGLARKDESRVEIIIVNYILFGSSKRTASQSVTAPAGSP
jgi:SAM-dependent methyltransferase